MGKNIKMENGPVRKRGGSSGKNRIPLYKEEGPIRKRGRPSGKNRIPLSMEERRARNAQYERERRAEAAEAMAELAEAMGVDSTKVQNYELLDVVIRYIQQDRESVDSLKSINQKLETQIQCLEQRLNPAAIKDEFLPETPPPLHVQCLEQRLNPAPVKDEFLPETPPPVPDVEDPMNYTDAPSSGTLPSDAETYENSNGVKIEKLSSPSTNIQTDDVELDFDFLLDYMDNNCSVGFES